MTAALTIIEALALLEVKYPCGIPIRHGELMGSVSGYFAGKDSDYRVIAHFEDGSKKEIRVTLEDAA